MSKYQLEQSIVDFRANTIGTNGTSVRVQPRLMKVLQYLMERPFDTVTRQQLLRAGWEYDQVNDEALTKAVSELRKLLSDDRNAPRIIETIPKVGYRFIGSARPVSTGPDHVNSIDTVSMQTTTVSASARLRGRIFIGLSLAATVAIFWTSASVDPPGDKPQARQYMITKKMGSSESMQRVADSLFNLISTDLNKGTRGDSVHWIRRTRMIHNDEADFEISRDTSGTGLASLAREILVD